MNLNLKLVGVRKKYKSFYLGPISLELEKGKVLALIGQNGAGKTTTLDCISGVSYRDEGTIEVCGYDANPNEKKWKNCFGYVSAEPVAINTMTGTNFLKYISKYYDKCNYQLMDHLIKKLEFPVNETIYKLSTGNKTKLEIISAMSFCPTLLLLDEPTNALDPIVRDAFLEIIFDFMKDENNSIIWSTHIVSEVAKIADDFAFICNGVITEVSSKIELTENWRKILIKQTEYLENIPDVVELQEDDGRIELISRDYNATMSFLKESKIDIVDEYYMSLENICLKNLQFFKSEFEEEDYV